MYAQEPSSWRKTLVVVGVLVEIILLLMLLVHRLVPQNKSEAIKSSYPQPLAYWPMEGNVRDKSNSGHDGVIQGDGAPLYIAGRVGRAIFFPHSISSDSCHVAVGDVFAARFTVTAWVYVEQATSTQIIQKAWLDKGFHIDLGTDKSIGFSVDNRRINSATPYPVREWFHVACTFDGSTMHIFLNGVLSSTGKQRGITNPTNGETRMIFRWPTHEGGFALDEVAFYDRALTLEEIRRCCESAALGPAPPITSSASPTEASSRGRTDF